MTDMNVKVDLGYWFFIIIAAVGMLNAWKIGQPWYIGLAIALVVGLFVYLGLIPIVGAVVYWILAKWFMISVVGIYLSWVMWFGMFFALIMTIVGTIFAAMFIGYRL